MKYIKREDINKLLEELYEIMYRIGLRIWTIQGE